MATYPGPITRRRALPSPIGGAWRTTLRWRDGEAPVSSGVVPTVVGAQTTVSEGHPWPPKNGQTGDIGGDFLTQKSVVKGGLPYAALRGYRFVGIGPEGAEFYRSTYDGPLYPMDPAQGEFPNVQPSSNSELDMLGATAVARCSPTNSVADLSVALGEMFFGGIPRLIGHASWDVLGRLNWKNRASTAKAAGEEYLNYEFGWKPLVSDINKFAEAAAFMDVLIAQYERDSGKLVRRRYQFPSEVATPVTTLLHPSRQAFPTVGAIHWDEAGGPLVRTFELVRNRSFSGAFTYHLPSGYDSRNAVARDALLAKKIFGLGLTPDTLWNLAPWSWAVDWFSNAGDVINNISDMATDGLVMHHGYVMEHTIATNTYSLSATGTSSIKVVPDLVYTLEIKVRRRAHPFGFGFKQTDLSTRQQAILVALGLTRG